MVTMAGWLVEREKRAGHREKEYAETFGKMLKTATMQLFVYFREF